MAIFTDAGWITAIATWGLLFVTGIAAYFGIKAAVSAANTYRLESQPVVLVHQLVREEEAPHDPAHLLRQFTVDGTPLLADGIELREWRYSDGGHPNAQLSANKSITLEIHNAGRSPALAVRVPFTVSVPVFTDIHAPDGPEVGRKTGMGYVTVPGIAANASVYVIVENLLGNEATLIAHDFGDYVRIAGKSKKLASLPIIAFDHITIPGA